MAEASVEELHRQIMTLAASQRGAERPGRPAPGRRCPDRSGGVRGAGIGGGGRPVVVPMRLGRRGGTVHTSHPMEAMEVRPKD
jgi:hypothetical protein